MTKIPDQSPSFTPRPNYMRKLTIVVVVFVCGSSCLAYFGPDRWADLGLNLFAGSVGLALTVFVVDSLLRHETDRRSAPQQLTLRRFVASSEN